MSRSSALLPILCALSATACGDSTDSQSSPGDIPDGSTADQSSLDAGADGTRPDSGLDGYTSNDSGLDGGVGAPYHLESNLSHAKASYGDNPGVIFRWRADGVSTSPGTLSAGLSPTEVARPAPFSSFKYLSFQGVATGATPGYVGQEALAYQTVGMTAQAWFRARAVDGTRTLFSNTGSNKGLSFDIKDGHLLVAFSTDDGGTAYRHTIQDATVIETGKWYSVAVSVAKKTDNIRVAFFVDGLRTSESQVALDHGGTFQNCGEMPAVAGEPTSGALDGEGFNGDMHAVMVHNYPVEDDILGSPWLRDGGRYMGMPSYHDYLTIPEPEGTADATPPYSDRRINLSRRISLTDRDSRFPSLADARVRLGLPLLNDRFIPDGVAVSDDGRTMWIGYHYLDDDGANPESTGSLIAEADLVALRLRRVYHLADAQGAAVAKPMGGIAHVGGRLYATVGRKVLWFDPSAAVLVSTPDADMADAPDIYSLQASESFAVRASDAAVAYDPKRKALLLTEYAADAAAVERYDLTTTGAIAHPSESSSDERLEAPASVHHVRGVLPATLGSDTDCYMMSSHDVEATGAAKATQVHLWCLGRKASVARMVLSAGVQALTLGPDNTLWVVHQSGGAHYQKRTNLQPWYDVLTPYVMGFDLDVIQPKTTNCQTGTMSPFLGDVHSHTSHSDGTQEPEDLFKQARDEVGLDYVVITDHSGSLTDAEYSQCKSDASAATSDGSFVGACGFEISMKNSSGGVIGHGNVLFASDYQPYPANHAAFYEMLSKCKGCLGQINHPASTDYPWTNDNWSAVGDPFLVLSEFNGGGQAAALDKYISLLDHGWHLAPSMNSDTHSLSPGNGGKRTGIFSPTLDLEGVKKALEQRRTFAGNAGNGASALLQAEGCWMGVRLRGYLTASFRVEAVDSAVGWTSIDLLSKGKEKVMTIDCADALTCSKTIDLELDPAAQKYLVAYANRSDGKYLITAPIWLE